MTVLAVCILEDARVCEGTAQRPHRQKREQPAQGPRRGFAGTENTKAEEGSPEHARAQQSRPEQARTEQSRPDDDDGNDDRVNLWRSHCDPNLPHDQAQLN